MPKRKRWPSIWKKLGSKSPLLFVRTEDGRHRLATDNEILRAADRVHRRQERDKRAKQGKGVYVKSRDEGETPTPQW